MKKKWVYQNKIKVILGMLTFILFLGGTYIYSKIQNFGERTYQELERGRKSMKREHKISPLKDNVSVLIMGEDNSETREGEYGKNARTDALMVATINKETSAINLLSIPRDTRVYIPIKSKEDKIAHAHAFGGIDSTVDTVEKFLDIPIDYYIKFNFDSFLNLIDTIGGIDVDVPVTFTEQDSKDQADAIHLEKGYQHLNGEQALALTRTRHIDNDFMRGQRQQLVIEAIAEKLLTIKSLNKFNSILDEISPHMSTNLSTTDIFSIAKTMMDHPPKINKMQIKCSDKYIDGIYYAQPNKESVQQISKNLKQELQKIEP
ncbi:LCP family protein [Bacillus cytotoxicus]|uniref:Cell envelope-related transcriptional attenuator n=3 Tax=Bacillus cytotoxicus TaxID=580165 RepID=A0AAX2CDI4_9BACI|nr:MULTISPECIES: LCP family protein [Bacillus cereus group]ABS21141.1 cell envelope-related transcriptional attenuator [Bacillus cytotoxicus NVH 391-98]MDH2859518.1 LCP family protein [Bacillus cytotoxicus]MDH2864035.1 LCP family protein [Bacillus cytotoxicus]MDH2867403.1 LCP family protein [Bacillus cytotoxicus]MDH2871589.1 LCP family protein [Bacillus cytotoxicus]